MTKPVDTTTHFTTTLNTDESPINEHETTKKASDIYKQTAKDAKHLQKYFASTSCLLDVDSGFNDQRISCPWH